MTFNYLTKNLQKLSVMTFLFGCFFKKQNAFVHVFKTQRRHFLLATLSNNSLKKC